MWNPDKARIAKGWPESALVSRPTHRLQGKGAAMSDDDDAIPVVYEEKVEARPYRLGPRNLPTAEPTESPDDNAIPVVALEPRKQPPSPRSKAKRAKSNASESDGGGMPIPVLGEDGAASVEPTGEESAAQSKVDPPEEDKAGSAAPGSAKTSPASGVTESAAISVTPEPSSADAAAETPKAKASQERAAKTRQRPPSGTPKNAGTSRAKTDVEQSDGEASSASKASADEPAAPTAVDQRTSGKPAAKGKSRPSKSRKPPSGPAPSAAKAATPSRTAPTVESDHQSTPAESDSEPDNDSGSPEHTRTPPPDQSPTDKKPTVEKPTVGSRPAASDTARATSSQHPVGSSATVSSPSDVESRDSNGVRTDSRGGSPDERDRKGHSRAPRSEEPPTAVAAKTGTAKPAKEDDKAGPGKSAESAVSVAWLNNTIRGWINKLGEIWVDAELSEVNARGQNLWLKLRDLNSEFAISGFFPGGVPRTSKARLEEGQRVLVFGRPVLHHRQARLVFEVTRVQHVGIGQLLAQLEQLKRTLGQEGLFDADRKRSLPFIPHTIGLICGRGSDAERDVKVNAQLRWPAVQFETREVAVQGANAVPQVVAALEELDSHSEVDVIVITRGGGSVEDLLAFSNETMLRAVASAHTPVVSAIGHERDSPLLDFVADLRASTPTDAAKRIVPDVNEQARAIRELQTRSRNWLRTALKQAEQSVQTLRFRPAFGEPEQWVDQRETDVERLRVSVDRAADTRLDRAAEDIDHLLARARSLSPSATLRRGYSIVQADDGALVTSIAGVSPGDALTIRVRDGRIDVEAGQSRPAPIGPGGDATGESDRHSGPADDSDQIKTDQSAASAATGEDA